MQVRDVVGAPDVTSNWTKVIFVIRCKQALILTIPTAIAATTPGMVLAVEAVQWSFTWDPQCSTGTGDTDTMDTMQENRTSQSLKTADVEVTGLTGLAAEATMPMEEMTEATMLVAVGSEETAAMMPVEEMVAAEMAAEMAAVEVAEVAVAVEDVVDIHYSCKLYHNDQTFLYNLIKFLTL